MAGVFGIRGLANHGVENLWSLRKRGLNFMRVAVAASRLGKYADERAFR